MPLADIGVNLADKRFASDLDDVMQRARAADVAVQIVTGTSLQSSTEAQSLCERYTDLRCTAGLHPHQASDFSPALLSELRQLAQYPRVCAIGETGLDFNRDFSPRPIQQEAFNAQLALAVELNLPAFLHQRDAHDHFHAILKEHRDQLSRVVVHCFTGNRQELFDYLDLDCYIGITGWICDPNRGAELQEIIGNIPLNRLLIETDSPYLTPKNMSGKPVKSGRNEPALLPWIARQVAESYPCEIDVITSATWINSLEFFALEIDTASTP